MKVWVCWKTRALIIFLKKNQAGVEKLTVKKILIDNCLNIIAGKRKNKNKISLNKAIYRI
jgi:hypothetical protein